MTLSEKLSTLMNLCDLSIKDVSKKTGISSKHIKKMLEKPDYNPSDKDIEILSLFFKLPLNGLMNPQYKVILKSGLRDNDIVFVDNIKKE